MKKKKTLSSIVVVVVVVVVSSQKQSASERARLFLFWSALPNNCACYRSFNPLARASKLSEPCRR